MPQSFLALSAILILTLTYKYDRMDLHENHQTNTVMATFELPGMKKEDIHISMRDGRLTVSGESALSTEHDQGGYTLRERYFGKFVRTLHVSKDAKVGFLFLLFRCPECMLI